MIARPAAMTVTVIPAAVRGTLAPPPSKSYAQRALAAALLADGTSLLHNIGCCDDTLAALRCIEALGARTERLDPQTLAVHGGLRPATGTLHVGESGLAARLFTPVAALCDRPVRIEGAGTLLRRPMGPMLDALQRLGARIEASVCRSRSGVRCGAARQRSTARSRRSSPRGSCWCFRWRPPTRRCASAMPFRPPTST